MSEQTTEHPATANNAEQIVQVPVGRHRITDAMITELIGRGFITAKDAQDVTGICGSDAIVMLRRRHGVSVIRCGRKGLSVLYSIIATT